MATACPGGGGAQSWNVSPAVADQVKKILVLGGPIVLSGRENSAVRSGAGLLMPTPSTNARSVGRQPPTCKGVAGQALIIGAYVQP